VVGHVDWSWLICYFSKNKIVLDFTDNIVEVWCNSVVLEGALQLTP